MGCETIDLIGTERRRELDDELRGVRMVIGDARLEGREPPLLLLERERDLERELCGGVAIVCSRGRKAKALCAVCKLTTHTRLCDFPLKPGKTCDQKLCVTCARHVGADRDLCPSHATLEHGKRGQLVFDLGSGAAR